MQNTDAPRVWSQKYPPVAQKRNELGVTDYNVVGADASLRLTPNTAIMAGVTERIDFGRPGVTSMLSGEPGYLYRTDVVEIPLSREEILRLFRHNLRPEEFFKLAQEVGVFYEISSKFYDEETGVAVNPQYSGAEERERAEREKRPQLFVVAADFGQKRPHSIMQFNIAEERRLEFVNASGLMSWVVDLEVPKVERPAALSVFDNIVSLHIGADGAMRAFGPFSRHEEAERYLPAAGLSDQAFITSVATVNSSFAR
jgi:hypothetical protein